MLWVPQKGVVRVETTMGSFGSTTPGTSVTTGGTASTKGTVAELIAATAFDAYLLRVYANNYGVTTTACEGAMDILIGAATEDMLIPDLLMGYCGGLTSSGTLAGFKVWEFPLYIPAGSRLSCQAAGARVSTAFRVGLELVGGNGYPPFRVGSKVVTYGMGTVPNGTTITPGVNAEGAYAQITAATTEDHFAFVPSFQVSADTTINNRNLQVDIGAGAATEEQIGSWWFNTNSAEHMGGPFSPLAAFQDVPSGTRLAMRCGGSGANDGAYNGVIHAVSA